MVVRSDVWRRLGGLDEEFFAHMEEIDFCWRAKLAGYRVCVVPTSVVYHVGGGTLPAESPMKLRLNYRNNLLMLRNNLARTFAAEYLRGGKTPAAAARKGLCKAGRRIFSRMILDGASAAIFLLTGRVNNFRMVIKAHGEYRKLKAQPTRQEIETWLKNNPNISISGIYDGCLPAAALVLGKKTFSALRGKIK